jgi:hypothetical protein
VSNKYKSAGHLQVIISLGCEVFPAATGDFVYRKALVTVLENFTKRNPGAKLAARLGGTFAARRLVRKNRLISSLKHAYLNHDVRALNLVCDAFWANSLCPLLPHLAKAYDTASAMSVSRMIVTNSRMFRFALLNEVYTQYLDEDAYPLSIKDPRYDPSDQVHRISVQSHTILYREMMASNVLYREARAPIMSTLGITVPH